MKAKTCCLDLGQPVADAAITIAIPTRNRPVLLREALASALGQRYEGKIEVLVVDNGNPDVTRPVIAELSDPRLAYYVNNSDYGMIGNWNQCLSLASAPWVSILHDDDLLAPWFLSVAACLTDERMAAIAVECYFGAQLPDEFNRVPLCPDIRRFRQSDFLWRNLTPFAGNLINARLARQFGGFQAADYPIADFAFWYALSSLGRMCLIKNVGALYRISDQQITGEAVRSMIRKTYFKRVAIGWDLKLGRAGARILARYTTGRDYRDYRRRYKGLGEISYCEERLLQRNCLRSVPGRLVRPLVRVLTDVLDGNRERRKNPIANRPMTIDGADKGRPAD